MLTEFHQVKQEDGNHRRRWFEGGGLELIMWYGGGGEPAGFQLCYQAGDRRERALTWRPGTGFSHEAVDGGESRPDKNLTPILVRDGPVPWSVLESRFAENSGKLEPAVRDYVLGALQGRAG